MSNLLSEVHPELVLEWSERNLPLTPDKITYGSNKIVWWIGTCGHESDHTGIVQKVENGRVYTVEGNSGDSVRQNSYPVGYYEILGYGAPAY